MKLARFAWLATTLVCLAITPAAASVQWLGSWPEATARSRATHKPLLAVFYKKGCEHCEALDSTLATPDVVAAISGYVCAHLDLETQEATDLAARWKLVGWPNTLVLDDQGNEIDRIVGERGQPAFLAELTRIRSGKGTVPDLTSRVRANPNDVPTLYELGSKLDDRGDEGAAPYLERVLALDSANASGKADDALLALGGMARRAKQPAVAISRYTRLLQAYPDGDASADAFYPLAKCHHELGNDSLAIATLEQAASRRPDDAWLLNQVAWSCAEWKVALDRGLAAAKRAVQLSNEDPGIMDTLAEVYFARGEYSLAVATEKKALAKKPGSPSLEKQLAKFEAAERAAKK